MRPTIGFIGAGKVGTVLARLLSARGFAVAAVYSRNRTHAEVLGNSVEAMVAGSIADAASAVDLLFLTVSDDAISSVAEELAKLDLTGKAVVHTSGVHEASILRVPERFGAMVGSLHPIYPFADVGLSISGLPGAVFGLQTQSEVRRGWLEDIVAALDGQILQITDGNKALYHSALVFASNYGVTLYAIAQRLLMQIGADRDASAQAIDTLMSGMLQNLRKQGIPNALTGPLVRGDVVTIESHIQALRTTNPMLADLYIQLAMQTLLLVAARGIDTGLIETILRKKLDDADNHT
ncbi:MAG: DUF2520 domain-containing protein [Anaerolineaceae bacterium]|nr:DUF2520 domain-containing protein [Anaerolineaceae bacterium]